MSLINRKEYYRREPFRDAALYLIICEGGKREPDYFKFFNELTSQLKVVTIPSYDGKSAPNHLISNANEAIKKNVDDNGDYELWFIIDVDRWEKHLHNIHNECSTKTNWNIAISNPCFEVWLYYHFKSIKPTNTNANSCSYWKSANHQIESGGFDSSRHPGLLNVANKNSQANFSETGYIPDIGSTQLHLLGNKIFSKVENILK